MKLSNQITINAPASQVWAVIAHDFAKIGTWASSVTESKINLNSAIPAGATVGGRVCNIPGIGVVTENFSAYDEKEKTYTFVATGMPFFVSKAFSSWVVRPLDAQSCSVRFEADMKMMPIIGLLMAIPMRGQLTKVLNNTTEELKYFVETGKVHPRKQKIAVVTKAAA